MNEILKIVTLNRYIQNGKKLTLSDKEVLCVALDRTCSFKNGDEITLTDDQLNDLFNQTLHGLFSSLR